MSFKDYYLSELQLMGVVVNNEGKSIDQMDKHELQQLLAVERYKERDVECDSEKWF